MNIEIISLVLSILAIIFTGYTFYFTSLRKGRVKMTKPSVIFLGPDGPESGNKKVFIRTLLYSTAQKGNYIQNMYLKLTNNRKSKIFNIWVYDNDGLKRGSGLYISEEGISANHHFLLNNKNDDFKFMEGLNNIEIFVEHINGKESKIHNSKLFLSTEQTEKLGSSNAGIYFDWDPGTKSYLPHVDIQKEFNLDQLLQKN